MPDEQDITYANTDNNLTDVEKGQVSFLTDNNLTDLFSSITCREKTSIFGAPDLLIQSLQ